MTTSLIIDGRPVQAASEASVLDAARSIGLDIPTLCYLEKCGPLTSCLACVVKINGKLVPSCGTKVQAGMVVESETTEVHEARRTALELLLSDHVGDCLAPCNRLCPLQMDIPAMVRYVQAGRLEDASALVRETLPLPAVLGRLCNHPCEQGCRRGTWDKPLGIRDIEQFLADLGLENTEKGTTLSGKQFDTATGVRPSSGAASPCSTEHAGVFEGGQKLGRCCARDGRTPVGTNSVAVEARTSVSMPHTHKSVIIIGAGPVGLTSAWELLRRGHACTLVDRHEAPGGSLRYQVDEKSLPHSVLDLEISYLKQLGAEFKAGVELGRDLTFEGLARGFDAILIATGEISKAEGAALGLEMAPTGIKAHPETFQTNLPAVFAAGRAVKACPQLVRAMGEGQAAACCIDQFLCGKRVQRPDKHFSSIMGRLDKSELEAFVSAATVSGSPRRLVAPELCIGGRAAEAGLPRRSAAEAGQGSVVSGEWSVVTSEALRCLHCDCRASGNCALQSYAQQYGADPGRFRQQRRPFEQTGLAGDILFEPGKCIRCGICVRLAELADEPLGITFAGRGFDIHLAAPFDAELSEGLQKVATEVVESCPTGAFAFSAVSH